MGVTIFNMYCTCVAVESALFLTLPFGLDAPCFDFTNDSHGSCEDRDERFDNETNTYVENLNIFSGLISCISFKDVYNKVM